MDFLGIPPIDVYRLSAYAFKERSKMYEVMQYPVGLDAAGVSDRLKNGLSKAFPASFRVAPRGKEPGRRARRLKRSSTSRDSSRRCSTIRRPRKNWQSSTRSLIF